jgi:hypothetical protein
VAAVEVQAFSERRAVVSLVEAEEVAVGVKLLGVGKIVGFPYCLLPAERRPLPESLEALSVVRFPSGKASRQALLSSYLR